MDGENFLGGYGAPAAVGGSSTPGSHGGDRSAVEHVVTAGLLDAHALDAPGGVDLESQQHNPFDSIAVGGQGVIRFSVA